VLRIGTGYSPDYLLKEVATGRENYYTGAVAEGEPPGRWWGDGAEQLGLTGFVDAQDMRGLYERFLDPRADGFADPQKWDALPTLGHTGRRYTSEEDLYVQALEREPDASAERRAELRTEAGKLARHNVAFLDATFSVQKSVTLLHTAFEAKEVTARTAGDEATAAAWGEFRTAVEDAIWAGNNAALAYLSDKAGYARVGHHGGSAGRWVDAHGWVVGSFFQHDSRDRDPQLHIHNAILNRVEGPDGTWRTLDSRAIHRWRAGAGAVAERTTEERLAATLGTLVATRPDGKSREVVGVSPEAMSLISTRRHAVTAKAAELIEAFEQRHGRAPNGVERDRLAQQATLVTRAAKTHDGETREQLLDRVDARLRADIDGGLTGIADAALAAREQQVTPMAFNPQAVVEIALEDVKGRKAGWTRSDLTRAINAALPDYLGVPDGTDVAHLLDQLTDQALGHAVAIESERPGAERLPDALRLANGESAYLAPGGRVYSTPDQVRSERMLLAATAPRDGAALSPQAADRFLTSFREEGIELGVDQAAAVRGILASGARVETLVGPAGTGKSFVVGSLARAWTDPALRADEPAGRVFGLATSQVATEVLTAEGLTARNVARWLNTQDRLAAPGAVGEDEAWRLRAGDLVVIDESAMTDTASLWAIHRHADAAGAKLLLVGDHRQLAAVGAGGGMDLLATAGSRYELADARRFTAAWERDASLRLRAGDDSVLRTYHQQGRLLDAGTQDHAEASAARAWLADTLDGHRSLLLVDTNDQAARLSAQLRAELVRLGRVAEHGVPLGRQGTYAGVGDQVQARRNAWDLAGFDGNRRGPINRETYRVTGVRTDGGLDVVTAGGETMALPARYVTEDLALGYAATVHAAQGSTVDTTHSVITPGTGPAALYVGMTRGREANTAHATTRTGPDDPAQGDPERHTLHRDPVAALAGILDASDTAAPRSAVAIATESADEVASTRTAAELLADAAQLAATERTAESLDQLVANGALSDDQRARIAAEDGVAGLTRVLRRAELAGHDPHRVLTDAVEHGSLVGSRNLTNVLYSRIRDRHRFDPRGDTWADWTPHTDNPEWRDYLTESPAPPTTEQPSSEPRPRTSRRRGRRRRSVPSRTISSTAPRGRARSAASPPTARSAATTTLTRPSAPHPSPARSNSSPPTAPPGGPSAAPRSTASTSSFPMGSSGCACAPTSASSPPHPAMSPTNLLEPARPQPPTARTPPSPAPRPRRRPTATIDSSSPPRRTRPPGSSSFSTGRPHNFSRSTTPAQPGSPTPPRPASKPNSPRPNSPPATPTTTPTTGSQPLSGRPLTTPPRSRTNATATSPRTTSTATTSTTTSMRRLRPKPRPSGATYATKPPRRRREQARTSSAFPTPRRPQTALIGPGRSSRRSATERPRTLPRKPTTVPHSSTSGTVTTWLPRTTLLCNMRVPRWAASD